MMGTARSVILRLLSPLWRDAAEDEDVGFYGAEAVRDVREGVVTHLFQDYGLIDQTVYFTDEQVLGGHPLRVGDRVSSITARDGAHGGWRALRVERLNSAWEDEGSAGLQSETGRLKHMIGTVTSYDQDGGFINHSTFFPRHVLCQGYKPMKGDWVQAQYVISQTDWSSQACSVWPLRYCRMDQVCVTSVFGSSGVLEDSVFFSLDSLLVPPLFTPRPGDLVSVVVLESSQSFYCWRAVCMVPMHPSPNPAPSVSDTNLQDLLESKGGIVVEQVEFGSLPLGGARELLIWIENQGSEVHTLRCYELAGWDPQEQFTLGPLTSTAISSRRKDTPQPAFLIQALYTSARRPFGSRAVPFFPAMDPSVDRVEDGANVGGGVAEGAFIKEEQVDLEISPGGRVSITVSCRARNLGRCSELLLLHFPAFTIGRRLDVDVNVSDVEEALLQPAAPYCPPPSFTRKAHSQVVTVQPDAPFRSSKRHLPNFIGNYPVPKNLRDCMEAKGDVLLVQPLLGELLSQVSMQPRFSTLLWLEELQAEYELQAFSLTGALLRRGTAHLHLEVPGVAERRPNICIGDRLLLKKLQSGGIVMEYVAYVVEIKQEDLSLRVNSEFQNSYLGEPLDVEFTLNRLTFRRCHCALEQAKHFRESMLFPSTLTLQPPLCVGTWHREMAKGHEQDGKEKDSPKEDIQSLCMDMVSVATQTKTDPSMQCEGATRSDYYFNPQLNPAQKEAVKRILAAECRPTPYVLFGPPGTGKTVTLVEAILQVYHCLPGSRSLICTPSNMAADLICLRLHSSGFLKAGSMVRVNASCRQEELIPEVLWQYCWAGEDIRQASFHRIVVSTCSSAGMFYQINLRVGHFTHVFIDEAGQATEPETLIPMGLLSDTDKEGQVVLAGDPYQLGPLVKSKQADAFGLGVSLLERLMRRALYSRGKNGYNPLLVTKLLYNYRSHEALLALPSRLFYAGELCARAEREVVDALCFWSCLPTKGFPVIFHGLRGKEMREGSNPSWFNPTEAVQVMLYCCQLAKKLYKPVAAADIGVITPYRKQVEAIRTLLYSVGLMDIKVGSVEEFQGQESLVVVLSMVRSNEAALTGDTQSMLGFVSDPKRFNVAVTRAKALLIIVGNPHVLIKDPCFSTLLQYCFDNGAFLGCDPPPRLRASHSAEKGTSAPEENNPTQSCGTMTCAQKLGPVT